MPRKKVDPAKRKLLRALHLGKLPKKPVKEADCDDYSATYYSIGTLCNNCGQTRSVRIKMGLPADPVNMPTCNNCGCDTLVKAIPEKEVASTSRY